MSLKRYLGYPILIWLRFWAKLKLKRVNPLIIGVTGSVGKTSTRIAIANILQSLGTVKEAKHANSESGIPLNILGLSLKNYAWFDWLRIVVLAPFAYLFKSESYDYYLVEMGIDSPFPPKNMSYLLSILRPHVGIVLNATLVHTAEFDSLVKDRSLKRRRQKLIHLIAQEKGKLVTTMDKSGLAILNLDQLEIADLAKQTSARTLFFGFKSGADVRILKVKKTRTSFAVDFQYRAQTASLKFTNFPFEDNYAYTFAAAITVGIGLGVPFLKTVELLQAKYYAPPGRWRVFQGLNQTTLVDSSYNASPKAMISALTNFKVLARRAYKLAVIGDMRELGQEAKQIHKDLATWLMNNVDEAVLFGNLTKQYTLPILKRNHFPVRHFERMDDLIAYLKAHLQPKSWLLFKGSQNTIFLERAVAALLLNKEEEKYLCRRGEYWDKIRAQTP